MDRFPWGHSRRFNDYSSHFRKIFSHRVQKISVDAGFTCPNRDGNRGKGGCTYCNNDTFQPDYCHPDNSITRQLEEGMEMFSAKYPSMDYLAYFQSYSNTYAPLEKLSALYGEALAHPRVRGLVVATRPDCLDGEILDYLAGLSEKTYVMLELGLESHLNRTLEAINRGHTFEESVRAIEQAAARNIRTCAHLILGLPLESRQDMLDQARTISQLPVENIKLHQLQIHKGTVMAVQYRKNPDAFHLFTVDEYTQLVVEYLEVLTPRITVERFVSESPSQLLIAPRWGIKNFEFVARVDRRLDELQTWQGRLA